MALVALVRRNRRRYGGYIVHVGIAVLFVGVAASSSFQHAVRARARARPVGPRRRLHGPLRAPDGDGHAQVRPRPHRRDAHPRGAMLTSPRRPPRHDAAPERGLLRLRGSRPGHGRQPDRRPAGQPRRAERGVTRDVWAAIEPDIEAPARCSGSSTPATRTLPPERRARRDRATWRAHYLKHPPPAQFHFSSRRW